MTLTHYLFTIYPDSNFERLCKLRAIEFTQIADVQPNEKTKSQL